MILRERALSTRETEDLLRELAPLAERGLKLVISRRLDLARAYGLAGVHLAADAIPIARARSWLGPQAWIGYSAHSGAEAREAAEAGVSYVTLSPIYATESKPGVPPRGCAWLAEATQGLKVPALALGGVTPARTPEVLEAGAWGVAAVTAIGAAPRVDVAAKEFQQSLVESLR